MFKCCVYCCQNTKSIVKTKILFRSEHFHNEPVPELTEAQLLELGANNTTHTRLVPGSTHNTQIFGYFLVLVASDREALIINAHM